MTVFLQLRSGNSGPEFVADNNGDAVIWDAAQRLWTTGTIAGGVTSFNARVGAVLPASGDYDSDQITNLSGVAGASVSDALDTLAAGAGVSSFNTRTGAVLPATNDYTSTQIQNLSTATGASVTLGLNALGPCLHAAANLTNISATLTPTGISKYTATLNTFTTINQDFILDPAGFTSAQAVEFAFDSQTKNVTFTNGGPAGPTLLATIAAGTKRKLWFMKDTGGNIYLDKEWMGEAAA